MRRVASRCRWEAGWSGLFAGALVGRIAGAQQPYRWRLFTVQQPRQQRNRLSAPHLLEWLPFLSA